MAEEKCEKDARCNTCNQTKPFVKQGGKDACPQEKLRSTFQIIKNRFGTSIIPGWIQQWALGRGDEEALDPSSVVTEGEEYVSVEKDLRRRKT
jgi:hypothetical protein